VQRRAPNRRRLAALASAGAVLFFWVQSAAAESPLPLQLEWTAPLECPTAEQVERELSRITRARPGRSLAALEARGAISRDRHRYRLLLSLSQNGAERQSRFDSPSCAPLLKAATLVIALAFGDGLEPPPPAAPGPKAPAAPAPQRDTGAETSARAPVSSHFRVVPWAGAVASSGFVGSTAIGAEIGLGLRGRHAGAFASAHAFAPTPAAERDGVTAELSATIGVLGGCGGTGWARLRLDGCLAFEAGAVRAHSRGAEHDSFVTLPWLAAVPSLVALLPLPRPFALRAEIALELPLTAPRYDVAPLGTLYATSRFVPHASLGVAIEL
jgi:hypothetical protein